MQWLDEELSDGVVPDDIPVEAEPPSDILTVNRMMRRLRHLHAQEEQVRATFAAEHAALIAWRDEQLDQIVGGVEYLTRALDGWARRQYEDDGTQTQTLPFGTLSLRRKRTAIDVLSEDQAVEWLLKNGLGRCVATKFSVSKSHLTIEATTGGPADMDSDHGVQYRALTVEVPDPETGEKITATVPGVRYREPLPDSRGLNFSIHLRNEHGEEGA